MSLKRACIFLVAIIFSFGLTNNHSKEQQKTTTMLIYDVVLKDGKLRNYRNVVDSLYVNDSLKSLNLNGFSNLKMSGSAQFSSSELPYIKNCSIGRLFIIDLRLESHGFVNGQAVSFHSYRNQANIDKITPQIAKEEKQLLLKHAKSNKVTIHHMKKHKDGGFSSVKSNIVRVEDVLSEKDIVQRLDAEYARFYVLDRHKPNDEQVDKFLDFVKALPKNAWLHFHCKAGRGRTTTFMVMYDMIRNAKYISFKEIIQRHFEIGGPGLNSFKNKKAEWAIQPAKDRYYFLKVFYQYINDENGYGKHSWSSWKINNHS